MTGLKVNCLIDLMSKSIFLKVKLGHWYHIYW